MRAMIVMVAMVVALVLGGGCMSDADDVVSQAGALEEAQVPIDTEADLSALKVCLDTCNHIEAKCERGCTDAGDWCVAGCDGDRDICNGTCEDIWGHHGGVLDVQSTGPVDHACKTAYSWCVALADRFRHSSDCQHNPQAAGLTCEEWAQQQEASCLVDLFECALQ